MNEFCALFFMFVCIKNCGDDIVALWADKL